MLAKFLGLVVLGVIGLVIYLFFYLGMTKSVEIRVEPRPAMHMIYKNHIGAYHMIGPVIGEVEKWAAEQNLRCALTFGEYLDDPAAQDQDRLRSHGGCLFREPVKVTLPEGFTQEDRAAGDYVVATFKGSPSVGPFKVYPKVQDYIQTHRLKASGAAIETYLIQGEDVTTDYLFPLAR